MLEIFGDWEDQVEFKKGEVIFHEQDPVDFMYVVTKGEVEVSLKGEPLGAELEYLKFAYPAVVLAHHARHDA